MRLKQKDGRRGIAVVGLRLVAHGLRDDTRLLGVSSGRRVIDIVGIFQRMRQHEARIEFAVNVDQPLHMRIRQAQRVIAGVKELDLGPECGRGTLRLIPATRLDLLERHARLFPGELGFPALAEGEANDLDAIAAFGVKRDGPACPPDEIAGMCRNHQTCLCHRLSSQPAGQSRWRGIFLVLVFQVLACAGAFRRTGAG
jgi:hypothetical protein